MADDRRRILKDVFGFDDFRPGQDRAIDALLAGRSLLAVMPTGAGKSLCYQVPALVRGGLTIVVSPLVALMQDQVAALKLAGVAADTINSSMDRDTNVAVWRRVAAGETRLLYLAPERLMTERMLDALAKCDVQLIAVDEAHCISQWGPAFRPEYEALARLREIFPRVPVIALTATADEATRQDIAARLFGGTVETLVLGFDRPNIRLSVAARADGRRQLLEFVRAQGGASGIVYCLSRKKTEETAAFLEANGIRALSYHAGMSAEARDVNQNRFMTEAGLVMAATIAFGMGIDKPDVAFVFHIDLPSSLEAYYQEIGRAGRDGRAARTMMLYGAADIRMRRMFIDQEEAADEHKRRAHARLNTLIGFCETGQCRRQVLLQYFGETAEPCGNCDTCLEAAPQRDGAGEAALVFAAIAQSGSRFGASHVIDILRGSKSQKLIERGHGRLVAFGSGAALKKEEWQSLVRQLLAGGWLAANEHGGLALTQKGQALARGEESFSYRAPPPRAASRAETAVMASGDPALLAALKGLRMKLARERQVPAYVIFSDRSLIDMAAKKPRDLDQFAQVHGVGAAKLKQFGQVFLAAIAAA